MLTHTLGKPLGCLLEKRFPYYETVSTYCFRSIVTILNNLLGTFQFFQQRKGMNN